MTDLEKTIYECALKVIPDYKKKIEDELGNITSRFIEMPFYCEGCIDRLLYDVELQKFTKIIYAKGKGEGISIGSVFHRRSAYFDYDKIDLHEIDISNLNQTQ